jgi:prevent-host-death family protein
MRTAGIREARHDLTALLDEVRKGRTIVITERGRPIARLVPVTKGGQPVPDLSKVRRRHAGLTLSDILVQDREDRL